MDNFHHNSVEKIKLNISQINDDYIFIIDIYTFNAFTIK